MILKCTYDRDIDCWVLRGKRASVGGEASLLLSDVRISIDVLDPTRIVEIAAFCDFDGQVSPQSLDYLRLLLGNAFRGFAEGSELNVDAPDLPVFQASKIAQNLALIDLEDADYALRGLDIVLSAQALGMHAHELRTTWIWSLLPEVAGLGHVLQENADITDYWPASARDALSLRASTYLEMVRDRGIESELLEDIEWLALLAAPVPDDPSGLAAAPDAPPLPASAATRSVQQQTRPPEQEQVPTTTTPFDEPEVHGPRLGRAVHLFGKGPIILESGPGISIARIPLRSGVSTEDLSHIRLRVVEKLSFRLISEAPLEADVDPRTERTCATARSTSQVPNASEIILDLCDNRLPEIDKHTGTLVQRHKALIAARKALVAEWHGDTNGSEDLWRVCRQVMQPLGIPTSNIHSSRQTLRAYISTSPDWLSQIVTGWRRYANAAVSGSRTVQDQRFTLEGALRAVGAGLGEGPTFALLCQAYAAYLVEQHGDSLSEEDDELAQNALQRALDIFNQDGETERAENCLTQLSILRGRRA